MKLVEIEWVDSTSVVAIWEYEPDSLLPLVAHSVGYLLEKNKKYVTICQSINGSESFGRRFTIPMGCVKKIKIVRK